VKVVHGGRTSRYSRFLPYALVGPFALMLFIFLFWPLLFSIWMSFTDWRLGFVSRSFVGFANYVDIFSVPRARSALVNTVGITAATVIGGSFIRLGLALGLENVSRGQRFIQLAITVPILATAAAMALIWRLLFDTYLGDINALLSTIGMNRINWLYNIATARIAVAIVEIWRSTGYSLLLFTAGISAIPKDVREAARVDGADGMRQFKSITWPLLAPTSLFVLIVLTARSFQSFDVVRVLTDGGPQRSTKLLAHMLFEEAFVFFNTGFASSLAVFMALIALSVGLLQFRMDKKVYYR
jgi:multiple sugar transport system permease protein